MRMRHCAGWLAGLTGALLLLLPAGGTVQSQHAPKAADPTEDCGCDEPLPAGPQLWATVDGVKIYDTDLKAALAPQVDPLLQQLKDLRVQGLEDLINQRLFDKEAKAANIGRTEYLQKKVDAKLSVPTEAEVQKWIDQNRARITQNPTDPNFRREVAFYLKDQGRIVAIRTLGSQLRPKYTISVIKEANTATADATRVLALVDGVPLRKSELDEFIKGRSYDLKRQIFEIRKQALDRKINDQLIAKEAARRGLPPQQLINKEILDKAPLVTAEQANAFYEANKNQIPQPLETVRTNIIAYLRQQGVQQQEQRFSQELRKTASINYSLPGVIDPVFIINTQGKPFKGPKEAPVVVVEFTDYECPRCAEIQPMIKETVAAFANKVRLVGREFPLTRHSFARKAAQAAQCAFEQGKYWEYTELMFKNQLALDEASLLKYAQQVGMDKALLASHLRSGIHDRAVQEDLDEGLEVGVSGTPTFYVNGRRLEDRTPEGLKKAIESALNGAGRK